MPTQRDTTLCWPSAEMDCCHEQGGVAGYAESDGFTEQVPLPLRIAVVPNRVNSYHWYTRVIDDFIHDEPDAQPTWGGKSVRYRGIQPIRDNVETRLSHEFLKNDTAVARWGH